LLRFFDGLVAVQIIHYTCGKFHQHFYIQIFRTNVVSAAFTTYMQLEKAAETMFVQKKSFFQYLFAKKLQSKNELEKSCAKHFCMKMLMKLTPI